MFSSFLIFAFALYRREVLLCSRRSNVNYVIIVSVSYGIVSAREGSHMIKKVCVMSSQSGIAVKAVKFIDFIEILIYSYTSPHPPIHPIHPIPPQLHNYAASRRCKLWWSCHWRFYLHLPIHAASRRCVSSNC